MATHTSPLQGVCKELIMNTNVKDWRPEQPRTHMTAMNRAHNASNPFQGAYKRVLTVCTAGLLRAPTAALVLSNEPYNYNTRAAGAEESFALIPVDVALLTWAQEVVVMQKNHATTLNAEFPDIMKDKTVIVLDIDDSYRYRDPELIKTIRVAYDQKALGLDGDRWMYEDANVHV